MPKHFVIHEANDAADTPRTCMYCVHYFITHETHFRYGCRALAFKSKRQPILDVIEASGQVCQYRQLLDGKSPA
jgi:hypothetical protein